MRNNILFFLLVFLIPVSCQKDSVPASVDGDKSIICQVSVMGANDTKSEELVLDSLIKYGFRMDAWLEAENRDKRSDLWPQLNENPHYIKYANITYTGDNWKSPVDTLKWTNLIWTNFWAQYPAILAGRSDLTWPAEPKVITDDQEKTPSFTYDMSAYAGEAYAGRVAEMTPDLLVAYSRVKYDVDKEATQPSEGLRFKFAHALSAIKFTNGSGGGGAGKYDIDTIKITGVCSYGECLLSGSSNSGTSVNSVSFKWDGSDTLSYNRSFRQITNSEGGYFSLDNKNYIFLIPQYLTSKAKLYAYISVNTGAGGIKEKEGWYPAEIGGMYWNPGYIYDYNVNFDPDKHILTVTVDEEGYDVKPGLWD